MAYYVVEGEHTNPMDYDTLITKTRIQHGPYKTVEEANKAAIGFMQAKIDNYYHRCWVMNFRERDPWDDWEPTVEGVDLNG